jgi:hypothetical protein
VGSERGQISCQGNAIRCAHELVLLNTALGEETASWGELVRLLLNWNYTSCKMSALLLRIGAENPLVAKASWHAVSFLGSAATMLQSRAHACTCIHACMHAIFSIPRNMHLTLVCQSARLYYPPFVGMYLSKHVKLVTESSCESIQHACVAEAGASAAAVKLKFRGLALSDEGDEVFTAASGAKGG